MKNLEKLRLLTSNLPNSLPSWEMESKTKVTLEQGKGTLYNLLNIGEIAVVQSILAPGTIYPPHSHLEYEYAIVYKGSLVIVMKEKEILLRKGDFIKIDPGVTHSAYSEEGAETIAITIPASKDFPK